MSNTRLTIVVRRDLQLSPGLLAAQVAHMADAFMRNKIVAAQDEVVLSGLFSEEELEWMQSPYLSVLAVNTHEELMIIEHDATEAGLQVWTWKDVIPSETLQRPVDVVVGVSIGPTDFDKIKLVTGTLPLY